MNRFDLRKCDCGATKTGQLKHSDWCDTERPLTEAEEKFLKSKEPGYRFWSERHQSWIRQALNGDVIYEKEEEQAKEIQIELDRKLFSKHHSGPYSSKLSTPFRSGCLTTTSVTCPLIDTIGRSRK